LSATIPASNHPNECTAAQTKPFTAKVWSLSNWERGQPKPSTLTAYRKRLSCAGPENRKAIKHYWRYLQSTYFKYRQEMLWREEFTPFYCSDAEMTFDGGWYSIPCGNVNAESGGRGGWTCNTYGVIDPTWFDYGGPPGGACGNSERTQSLVAHKIYESVGTAAWTPFE